MHAHPSGDEVIRALIRLGFSVVGQKGSHRKLRNGTGRTVIVPMHDEIRVGTMKSICLQAGVTRDALFETDAE